MSLGAWVAFYGFLLSPIFYKVYSAACLYCPGGSAIDLLPMFYHSMGIAACGLLLAVGGYVLGRQDGFVSVRAISFDTGTEADALVGSVDSSILPGPHQQKEEELPVECPSYVQKALGLERPEPELMGQWHRGHTCRLQCGVACLGLIYLLWLLRNLAITLSSYEFLEWWLDEHWGFTTEEGRDFTAPVLVGEWGYLNHGPYWLGFVRYMSRRDLDFAYWPLNGRKYTTGHVVPTTGAWLPLDNPEWENETYGLLSPDYHTLNEAWRIRDLQALMESPARWNPTDMGCKTRDHSYYDCSTGIYWLENFTG